MDAHIAGYYALVYADTTDHTGAAGRGLRALGRGKAETFHVWLDFPAAWENHESAEGSEMYQRGS
jgi:hypothetical protein